MLAFNIEIRIDGETVHLKSKITLKHIVFLTVLTDTDKFNHL